MNNKKINYTKLQEIKIKYLKNLLKENFITLLQEEITYDFSFKNKKFKTRFDVNSNPTKKGLKIQFIPTENIMVNPNEARQLINELQIYLNQKLGSMGMAVDFDADVPYKNVIGFTVKLGSISNMIIRALGGNTVQSGSTQVDTNLNPNPDEKTKIN